LPHDKTKSGVNATVVLKRLVHKWIDNILDRVTASDPSVTDYVLEASAKCPNCGREVLEKTLVELL